MPSPPGCAQDSQPLHHPGSSPGALTAPSQVPRPPSQHLQDPQLTTRMGARTTPILQTRKLRPCHLPKDSSEEAEEGTTLNHTARWPPATLRTSRSSHCQLTHFLLELGGLAVQEGAQGCGPSPLGSPTSLLNGFSGLSSRGQRQGTLCKRDPGESGPQSAQL